MDSLGRRVYGVDERTFDRELKTFFDKNFQDRLSTRATEKDVPQPSTVGHGIVEGGINIVGQIAMVFRFIIAVLSLYLLFSFGKRVFEEMERNLSDEPHEEGDAFDKLFGSEFKGKFKNSRMNKGVYKTRQEELRLKNLKDDDNTTAPTDVKKMLPNPDYRFLSLLKTVLQASHDQYVEGCLLKDILKTNLSHSLFRILYRGYTYRELMSPKTNKEDVLKEATSYIIECLS